MLNPFPIQFLSLFAYFVLRVTVASLLVYLGFLHLKHRRELKDVLKLSRFPYGSFVAWAFPLGEIIVGLFLFAGAWTQFAALAVMAMSLKMLIMRSWFDHPAIPSKLFYFLLLGAATSLFITGAGTFAFDLPI